MRDEIAPAVATDPVVDMLRELIAEVRGLRTDLRREHERDADLEGDLVYALAGYFGPGSFSAAGVLLAAEDDPHSSLALAVAATGVLDTRSPTIALGRLFGRMRDLEPVGDRRGSRLYRARGGVAA